MTGCKQKHVNLIGVYREPKWDKPVTYKCLQAMHVGTINFAAVGKNSTHVEYCNGMT
jgi:hypothetical protein